MEQTEPQSLQHRAYRELKRRIVLQAYKPGEQINTARICKELQLGRTPVHLAIHRLEIDGLVDILPRRGLVVRPIDRAEMLNLIEVRLIMEPECAALAATRMDDAELAAIRAVLDRAYGSVAPGDHEALAEIDREFHSIIAAAARNRPLEEILSNMQDRFQRLYFVAISREKRDQAIGLEHEAIYAAFAARDAAAARAQLRGHIESFRDFVSRFI